MSIKSKIANWLLKERTERLETVTKEVIGLYEMAPYAWRGSEISYKFQELRETADTQYFNFLLDQMKYDRLGVQVNDETRKLAVEQSRISYIDDPMIQFIIEMWTDFGVGLTLDVVPRDPKGKGIWEEFYKADRNQYIFSQQSIQKMSTDVLIDGEIFVIITMSTLDGEATIRYVRTHEIVQIINNPNDRMVPVFYKREMKDAKGMVRYQYYQDYRATPEDVSQTKLGMKDIMTDGEIVNDERSASNTQVLLIPMQYRISNGRGWPLMTAGFAWSEGFKNFAQDRAAVARAAATFPEKGKVQGGQRALDLIKRQFQSGLATGDFENNPRPAAGSMALENSMFNREWRDIRTNGVDAKEDGLLLLKQTARAGKVYPHYLGEGDAYRLATATAMEAPVLKSFNRYQNFWSDFWKAVLKVVLQAQVEYNNVSLQSFDADVNLDAIPDVALEDVVKVGEYYAELFEKGIIGEQTANILIEEILRISMQGLGVSDVASVLSKISSIQENYSLRDRAVKVAEQDYPVDKKKDELEKHKEDFEKALAALISAFYLGKIFYSEFVSQLRLLLENNLRIAWDDAVEMLNQATDAMTLDESTAFWDFLEKQYGYMDGLAQYIQKNRVFDGKKRDELDWRQKLWANAFYAMFNIALLNNRNDPKLRWDLGATDEHCEDCYGYNGVVKRASYWRSINAIPQSDALACKGYHCDCRFTPTDEPEDERELWPPKFSLI